MNESIPRTKCDHVLVGVKAKHSGWPTASLDPGSGRRRSTRTKSRPTRSHSKIHQFRSPRFQGIAAR